MDIFLAAFADLLRAWSVPLGQDGGIKMGSRPPPWLRSPSAASGRWG